MARLPKELKSIADSLASIRGTWENHWQEITDLMLPNKNTITSTKWPGQKRNRDIFDNTAIVSGGLLSGFLHSTLTSPNRPWFELTTGEREIDERDDVGRWLQRTSRQILNTMNGSNFQTEVSELYSDLVYLGTGVFTTEEDKDVTVRYRARFIKEVYIRENNLGKIDEVYRKFEWDARQIAQEFGEKVLTKDIKKALRDNDTRTFEILHAIYPRTGEVITPFNKAFASTWMLYDDEKIVREDGFNEFPFAVPRWSKAPGEVYGRGPGVVALPDTKMINVMTQTVIKGAQKVVDPPMQAPSDGFLFPIMTRPGGLNFYTPGTNDRIEPILNDARIDFGFQAMDDRRNRIKEAFFVDQLQLGQGPQMTATEVLQRTEEKQRLLGPLLGRMQSEFLRPVIDKTFEIMARAGKFDEAPEIIQGRNLDVNYSSMIARSQKVTEIQNILRYIEVLQPMAAVKPEILDIIDGDAYARETASLLGVSKRIFNDTGRVQEIRDARADAQERELQAQREAQRADNAVKISSIAAQSRQAG